MKPLPLLLIASLAANAALVVHTLRSPATAGESAADAARRARATRSATTPTSPAAGPIDAATATELVAALQTGDPASLRDLLKRAGFSDEMVRSLVQASIWKGYEARMKALRPAPDPNKPWWKDDRTNNNWYGGMTKAQRDEMRTLQRDLRDETLRVLGPDAAANPWVNQDARYSFLSPEKRTQLQEVEQDYNDLMSEIRQESQGFRLGTDAEKLRFLEEEKKRDLAALMSPEELQTYELRNSRTAQQLRWRMTQFDASEDEYRALYPLQKQFDDVYNNEELNGRNERTQEFYKARQEAEKALKDQMRVALGDERYTDLVRSQQGDYQQLQAATKRLDLPADTPSRVYALRDQVAASSQQIAADPNLGDEQKRLALGTLAANTRAQITQALGAEGAAAYFKNNGMSWLKEVEKGNTVSFDDNGGVNSKSLPKPKPAPKP